jgi:hypothetical protein
MTKLTRINIPRSATQTQLYELQQRYEILSKQEKERVNSHLLNIYEILGIDPGGQLEEGQNYFQLLQFLFTNVNDHTLRIGRLEQVMEKILEQLSTQSEPSTKISVSTHRPVEHEQNLHMQTDRQNRQTDSSRQTADRHRAIVIIKQVEIEHPGTSLRQHVEILKANGIEMGKDTVNKIIHDLRSGGYLSGDDLLPDWNNERL